MESSFLNHLEWRYAVKAFDPDRRISESDFSAILKAIRFAPSAFGLQPYHVISVEAPALRVQLRAKGFDQPKITESGHFLIFCSRTDFSERLEQYLATASGGDPEKRTALAGFEAMVKGALLSRPQEALVQWAHRQTYLALGFALAACAERGIDSCPIEGFEPSAFDEILQLPPHLKSVVCLSIGVRATGPEYPKFRYPESDLFSTR